MNGAGLRSIVVLAALMTALPVVAWAEQQAPVRGTLCTASEGVVLRVDRTCRSVEGLVPTLEATGVERRFLWVREDQRALIIGSIPRNTTTVDLSAAHFGTLRLSLSGDKARGWPDDVQLHFAADDKNALDVALPNAVVTNPFSIGLPSGSYGFTVTARHHLRLVDPQVTVKARAETILRALRLLAAPRFSATVVNAKGDALPSAMLSSEGRVIAHADVNGILAAELPEDLPEFVEVIADNFAPHRIAVDANAGDIALGRLVLRRGASLAVTLDRTKIGPVAVRVAVLARDQNRRYQEIIARDLKGTEVTANFAAIEAGDYSIGVEGPSPLARYTEALRLPDAGAVEKHISIDPIEITGEIMIGSRRAKGGVLGVQPEGGGWEVGVEVGEDGSFHAESWEEGLFSGYYIRDRLRDSAHINERLEARFSPAHWHIVLPDRSLSGRIFDQETGQPVPGAALDQEMHTDAGGAMGIVPVQPDGSFFLDSIEPGDYTLKAMAEHYMTATVRIRVNATDTVRTVEIPLERGIAVLVNIVTPAGEPLAHATVIDGVGDGINPDHLYGSDGAGQLTLRLRPDDKRTLYILPREGSFAIADVSAANAEQGIRIVVPPPAGTIHVRATAGEKPVRGVLPLFRWNGRLIPPPVPRFFPFADPRMPGIWTDEDGVADFKAMPAGVYEFFAIRSAEDKAAVLRGENGSNLVRLGFTGGAAEVAFELAGPSPP